MSRYTLQRKLGEGGMGDVWEGVDASLGRRVAIKTIKPDLASDPQMFARFRQEAETAASLGHPNIVQIIELTADSPPLLVMEMLDGKSLRDVLHEEGRLPPARACFIALQILSALSAAHGARIVHRDIKPGNVFVVKTLAVRDFVKVLDFGIAKLLDRTLPDGSSALTSWGDVLGTTAYMAPEQALGMPVDARADLFAVGAILYEALSGAPARPHGRRDVRDAAFTPCKKVSESAPWVDHGLAALVDRALALDPTHRFASAEEMVGALTPFAQAVSGPRIDVTQTTRDAPPTWTAPATVPATAPGTAPATNPRPIPLAPQALERSMPARPVRPKPIHWAFIVAPLGVVLVVGLGIVALLVSLGYEARDQEAEFVRAHSPRPCEAPRDCQPADPAMGFKEIGGKRYGACMVPAPAPADTLATGDLVFYEDGYVPSIASVVSSPDATAYRVQGPFGDPQNIARTRIIGRACVAK